MSQTATKPYEARAGYEILEALDRASKGVQAAADELSKLSQDFHEAVIGPEGEMIIGIGLQYETAIRDEIAFIYQNAIEQERKPPPADVREAMAERAVQTKKPDLWAEYHHSKARIDALKLWISNLKAVISANQSLARGERE